MRLLQKTVLVLDVVAAMALALATFALAVPYGLIENMPELLALRGFGVLFELGLLALCGARILQMVERVRQAPNPRRLRAAGAPAPIGDSRALGS